MAHYMIEVSHDPSVCMQTLDEYERESRQLLSIAEFGCRHGIHTLWAEVEASNEAEARMMLPMSQRGYARVAEVDDLTVEQIRMMHRAA